MSRSRGGSYLFLSTQPPRTHENPSPAKLDCFPSPARYQSGRVSRASRHHAAGQAALSARPLRMNHFNAADWLVIVTYLLAIIGLVVFVAPVHVGGTVVIDPGQMCASAPVPQAMPLAHAPQSCVPPQPLPMTPQYWPPIGVHDVFWHVGSSQTFGTPPALGTPPAPPQVPPLGQVPQSSVPPQPSPIVPQ